VIAASAARAACASAGCCAALSRDSGLPAALKVFVGRSAEFDLLTSTHGRVIATGEPHLVTILGEPGVGTTSSSASFADVSARAPPGTWAAASPTVASGRWASRPRPPSMHSAAHFFGAETRASL
jgi:hypothetical protein